MGPQQQYLMSIEDKVSVCVCKLLDDEREMVMVVVSKEIVLRYIARYSVKLLPMECRQHR